MRGFSGIGATGCEKGWRDSKLYFSALFRGVNSVGVKTGKTEGTYCNYM